MKKIIAFIAKGWKIIIGAISGVFLFFLMAEMKNTKVIHLKVPNIKKLNKDIDNKAKIDKKTIDTKTTEEIKKIKNMNNKQIKEKLPESVNKEIEDIKAKGISDITKSIIDRIKKEGSK